MSSPSLTGISPNDPKKYLGPYVSLMPIVLRNREPTGADIRDPNTGKYYPFGCHWIVGQTSPGVAPSTGTRGDLWYLNYIAANIAYWSLISSGAGDLLSLSDNQDTQVFPSLNGDTPPNNIQLEGQLNQQIAPHTDTTVADVAGHIMKINPMSSARWIVDPLSTSANPNGSYTTIQAALDRASAGDTIIVMPGTYDETLTLKNSVNLVGFDDDVFGTVLISGTLTLDNTATGTYFSISGIRFSRSTGTCITHSGNETRQLVLTRCRINVSNTATGISLTNTALNSIVDLNYCSGDASDAGSKIFAVSGTDLNSSRISFNSSYFTNGAATTVASTTANTNSSGFVIIRNTSFALPITTSGDATFQAYSCDFTNITGTVIGNVTNLTIGGAGTNKVSYCIFNSGTASAISIGSTLNITGSTVTSSNANAITGAGSITYQDLSLLSSLVINTTTRAGGTLTGIASGDAPSAGFLGQQIRSAVASGDAVASLTTAVTDITSIVLTAGVWDVSGIVMFHDMTTSTLQQASVHTTSATLGTAGDNLIQSTFTSTTAGDVGLSIPSWRVTTTGATVYLVGSATYTVGTGTLYGRISATRVG